MRAIWKGAVAFGLVNVPVRLYSATGEHEVTLHQVHKEDGGRIRYRKFCSIDGEPVEMSDIAKGYETDDGELVVLTDEDFASLPLSIAPASLSSWPSRIMRPRIGTSRGSLTRTPRRWCSRAGP